MLSNQLDLMEVTQTHSLQLAQDFAFCTASESPQLAFSIHLPSNTAGTMVTMVPLHWTARIAVCCYLLLALAAAESETCSVQNASCGRALLQKQLTGSQAANCPM